jgi:hypothetical protein
MTTYSYNLTLNDGEVSAVKEAMERYQAFCREQLSNGPKCPYWAHLRSLESALPKLFADAQMMSTSSSCWPVKTDPE